LRLQCRKNRIVGDSTYVKWIVTIPPAQVTELGWKEGEYLMSEIKGGDLVLRKNDVPKEKPKSNRSSYEQFKSQVSLILRSSPEGLSWTQLREQLGLPQKVPNNLWVKMMEKDINLLRTKDQKSGKTIWRIKSVA